MKLFKRILSGIIATALSASVVLELPKEVFPKFPDVINTLKVYATDEIASGVCGENLTWTIDADGVLTIDGTGDMYTYEYTASTSGHPTYSAYDSVITKVIVGENVSCLSPYAFICYYSVNYNKLTEVEIKSTLMTKIPNYCFCQCPSLSKVKLPNQITTIEMNAFSSCPITTINMPTQLKEIGANAFYKFELTKLDLPYGLEKIGRSAFEHSKIEEIIIPETVKEIGEEAFYYSNLKKLTLHDKGLTIGEYAFANSKLEELHLPANIVLEYDSSTGTGYNFYNSSLKKLYIEEGVKAVGGAAFASCHQLEEVYFPSTIEAVGRAVFSGCENLKIAKLPDSITSIGINAFSGCGKCEDFINLKLPANLKSLGSGAFSGTGVESIYIPKTLTNLEASWGFFEGNYRFTSLKFKEYIVDSQNPEYSSIDGVLYNKEQTQVIDYPLYKEDESYTFPSSVSIMSTMGEKNDIAYNKFLKTIIFPDDTAFTNITELNDTIERENHNQSIETIILPRKNIPISTWAFSYLDNLKVLYIPSEITEFKGSILLNCPNAVIYCQAGSTAETYAKNNNYKYKIVNGVKIDNGYVIFPSEITLGGVKHITPEIIGEVNLSNKEISWNSDDSSINVLSYVNENGSPRVNFIARELGVHTINMVVDGKSYTLTFNVVEEKATGFIGTYVKSNVDQNGVFVPKITNGTSYKLYDDSAYINEIKTWIEKLGYEKLFDDYLTTHTYQDLLALEIAMPIKDSGGNEYLWTNTKITVKDMITYIIFLNDNKYYLESMEKEISESKEYPYQTRIYSLDYQSAYDYLINLYIANCELENDLTGNECMMKYLSIIAYGIIATEDNLIKSTSYSYVKQIDKLKIDDITDQDNDFIGFIISGGDTNELSYNIKSDVDKAKEKIDDGYTVFRAVKTFYDYKTDKITKEELLLNLGLDSMLPTFVNNLEESEYISKDYIRYCEGVNEFVDITKSFITSVVNLYTKPTLFLIGLPVKLSSNYIEQVKECFFSAEKQDAGWYALTMYLFIDDESKLGAYIDPNSLKIRSLLESNLNFCENTDIERGIMADYETKYALGDGSFSTLPNDSKILVLTKAAVIASNIKQIDTETKAEELLQHIIAQIQQDDLQEKIVSPMALNEIVYGQTLSEVKLSDGWNWTDGNVKPNVQNDGFEAYKIVTDNDYYDYSKLDGYTYTESDHKLKTTVTVSVKKAAPQVSESTAKDITYGQKLSDSVLSDTNWSWVSEDTVPDVQNSGYEAVITVDDSNYDYTGISGYDSTAHTVTRTVAVTVNKADITADMLEFTAPANFVYDGHNKTAAVTAKTGLTGIGEITIRYYVNGTKVNDTSLPNTYTVRIDAAEGANFNSASDITDPSWTFTVTAAEQLMPPCDLTLTLESDGTYTAKIGFAAGAEYKFNDGSWSENNTLSGLGHGKIVTAYIRMKATATHNASAEASDSKTTGHGIMEHHTAVPATCVDDGTIEYWSDAVCGMLFSDADGIAEITVTDTVQPATGHSWSTSDWKTDQDHHWRECLNGCGEIKDKAAHIPGPAATEDDPQVCTECGYEIAPVTGHIHTNHLVLVPAVSESCFTDGNTEYYECSCGKFFSDNQALNEITAEDFTIAAHHTVDPLAAWESDNDDNHYHICSVCSDKTDVTPHSYDSGVITTPATETTEGVKTYTCSVCNHTKTETVSKLSHTHSLSKDYSKDETGHWHTCSGCDEKVDFGTHTEDSGTVTVQPTETSTGVMTYYCSVCGYEMRTETIPVIQPEHTHNYGMEWKSDSTSHWHECPCGEKTDTAQHISNGGTVTVQPTAYSTGLRTYSCTVCGYVIRTESIPATGSNYYPTYPTYPTNPTYPVISTPSVFTENLTVKAESDGSTATLGWDKVENADKYYVYQYKDGKYVKIRTTTDTSVMLKGLKNGETYKFLVRYSIGGKLSPMTYSYRITVKVYYKPIVKATSTENSIKLTWRAVPNAEKYAIYRYVDGKAVKLAETTKLSVIIKGLKPDTECKYIVSAYVDGEWTSMKKSDIVTIKTKAE